MRVQPIQQVDESTLDNPFFGIKYAINSRGVNISIFNPTILKNKSIHLISSNSEFFTVKLFQLSLVEPFFLPLQSNLNGLFEECIFLVPETLTHEESINVIWIFHRKKEWKLDAVNMYESYLNGNDNPSETPIFRKVQDKVYSMIDRISPVIGKREFSEDVGQKISDEGYLFQCMIEIKSDRFESLSKLLQDIFALYDYQNGLKLESIPYKYPYNFYQSNQILSKKEILSLFTQTNSDIGLSDNPLESKIKDNFKHSTSWKERIKLLPVILNQEIREDGAIVPKLADALKRVGIINQARLYSESIQYGSRLIIVTFDIPKNKIFSDIEKKRKDIQVALGVSSLGIEQGSEPDTVKFSIPHESHRVISLREIIEREDYCSYQNNNLLAIIAGMNDEDNPIYLSLRNLKHLLITGATGSGKSVFVNQLLTTLIITNDPNELHLYLIDPKQVELKLFEHFPHTIELVTDMDKSLIVLFNIVREMEKRYKEFSDANVKDIDGYNSKSKTKLPYLVVVIEEYADLRDYIGNEIETPIKRLGQKARAAGIHIILITQRPSAKVLNSDIQANFSNAISFNLNLSSNYKTVFGKGIPFQLLGNGDGVMRIEGYPKEFQRFQSPILAKNDAEESLVISKLSKTYQNHLEKRIAKTDDDSVMDKLKRIIASTKETKVSVLRDKLGIKTETVSALMQRLVDEGWLIRHKSKSKGYELIADETTLIEWRDNNGYQNKW